jgi:TonB family protein
VISIPLLEGRIQLRSVGDRYGTEDRTFNVRGYNIFDLLLKYKWNRYEFLFAIDNIANKKWRAAKPIQTAKASYPLMALRMGLEADAVLKILVDAEGKVVKVEIIKSAGMGFDEEALKAVRQFRFEPAQRDGRYIASEFTYIYRFRLEK